MRIHTECISRDPALSRLGGIETVRVSRGGKMCLVVFVPLNITFTENEHTPRLQALHKLSDSSYIVCYLKRTNISGQIVVKKMRPMRMGIRRRELTPEAIARMWIKSI